MDHIRRWLAAIGAMIVALLSGCMRAVPSIAPEKVQSQMVSVYLGQKNDDFVQAFLDGVHAYLKQQDAVQLQLLESPEQLSEETDMVVTYEEEASCFASAELLLLEESESSIVALGKEIRQQLLSDLQERGAEVPQIYFLGANEAADWQYALYAEIQENFAQGGESVALQEKIVSGEQATKWLEGHPGELAVVAADAQAALYLRQGAIEAGRQHQICIFSLEYSREIEQAIRMALIYGALLENPMQMGENIARELQREAITEPGRMIICRANLDLPEIKMLRTLSE